jgi:site-specific recombinase XerD
MGDMRSDAIKSPRPYHNPFTQFRFVNLEAYKTNTAIIPEIVIEGIDRHLDDLNETYQLIYRIFAHTGMRMKEALFLEIDCIEPSRYDNLSQIKYTPYKVLSARRKAGLEDCHRVLVPASLAADILEYAKKTQKYRNTSGLPYIFLNAKYHGRINMSSMGSFVHAVNKLIKNYNICDENGKPWHFTTRQSRKTLAVTLIENGASTAELAYWLGHLASSTAMRYYAEVRHMKLAQLNTAFFKKQFDLLLSKQQLETFTEEERKLLYIDFRLERRRVEFGFCLLRPSDGECPVRHSLYNCVNCRHLCTGKKYLEYWQQLLDEQTLYLNELLRIYTESGILEYMDFKEYRKAKFFEECYSNIVKTIGNGDECI